MIDRSTGRRGAGATILIVDDETEVADLYTVHLDDLYEVRTAYGGEAALEAVDGSVDVVLLDRRMPDISGDEVLERIRERGLDCRVVVVTAIEPDFDIVDMEFDDYLTKPVDRSTLQDVVERQLVYDSYDARLREYLQLRSKIEVLERQKSRRELDENDRYNELKVVAKSLHDDLLGMIREHDDLDLDEEDLHP
ncbi:response regulator [Halobacteriales archaeon QS_8_69_26]|nr:MAG: response regulator [Halobacteriales archaeon QS_8_69_26]